jgi:hypothetical protein
MIGVEGMKFQVNQKRKEELLNKKGASDVSIGNPCSTEEHLTMSPRVVPSTPSQQKKDPRLYRVQFEIPEEHESVLESPRYIGTAPDLDLLDNVSFKEPSQQIQSLRTISDRFRNSATWRRNYVQIIHEIDDGLKKIKECLNERRLACKADIHVTSLTNRTNEGRLDFLSKKQYSRWKRIQSMTAFLSFLRSTLRAARHFGLETFKNRTLIEMYLSQKEKPWYIIQPGSLVLSIQAWILYALGLYLVTVSPLTLALEVSYGENPWDILNWCTTAIFVIDIFINSFSAIRSREHTLENLRSICIHYWMRRAIFDLVCIIPYSYILEEGTTWYHQIFEFYKFLKLINVFLQDTPTKELTRKKYWAVLKWFTKSAKNLYIMSSLISTFIFLHVCACIWCFFSTANNSAWIVA